VAAWKVLAPQLAHATAPLAEYLPARHSFSEKAEDPDAGHAKPAGQLTQLALPVDAW
jgi:hypothetical protein